MSSHSTNKVGAVTSVWRYAVKSMSGESLEEALVTDGGILGDRAYAVIDQSNGKVASAKFPRKWGGLIELNAAFVEPPGSGSPPPPVRITWSDGSEAVSSDDATDSKLSESVGRPVTLTTSRPEVASVERLDPLAAGESLVDIGELMVKGKFADYAHVHLLTTATLARLSELSPGSRFEIRQFRPNLVVKPTDDQADFVENAWVGQTVLIGDDVRLRVTDPTPRCSIPTLAQGELPKDPKVLQTIVEHNQLAVPALDGQTLPCVGVYAFVIQGGIVRRGDGVRIE